MARMLAGAGPGTADDGTARSPSRALRHRPRVGILLTLVILVPTLGMGVLAWNQASDRWSARDLAVDLEDDAIVLQTLVGARADFNDEWMVTAAIVSAGEAGSDVGTLQDALGVDVTTIRDAARGRIILDEYRLAYPELVSELDELELLRARVDAGEATVAEVNAVHQALADAFDQGWQARLDSVRETMTSSADDGDLSERVEALEAADLLLRSTMNRGDTANQLLTGHGDTETIARYFEATGQITEARVDLQRTAGPATRAAWHDWRRSPATATVEAVIDGVADDALANGGRVSTIDLEVYTALLGDGAQWMSGLAAVSRAAASDLADLAAAHHDTASRQLMWTAGFVALLAVAALVAGLALARSVVRPLRKLAEFAHDVGDGDFDRAPPPPAGPFELAQTGLAVADMTSTFAAVEDYVLELARDPASPSLDRPLPGRTGQALQATVDSLRASMRADEENRRQLEEMATHDGLTGLLNRAAALEAMRRDLARSRRSGEQFAAVFIDLDGLKAINDSHGHEVGDQAIAAVADVLRTSTRQSDVVARLGGDEFLVALTSDGVEAEASRVVARILELMREQAVVVAGQPIPVRGSLGVAVARPGDTAEDVIKMADRALYDAKQRGRDRVRWFTAA